MNSSKFQVNSSILASSAKIIVWKVIWGLALKYMQSRREAYLCSQGRRVEL